jgi:cytochrome oxidase Cu insertion factor (SCO1/SenC/PrrC family)
MSMKSAILGLAVAALLPAALASAQVPDSPQEVCALMVGQVVPDDLTVLDARGEGYDLSAAMKAKPTLLIFYRGGW